MGISRLPAKGSRGARRPRTGSSTTRSPLHGMRQAAVFMVACQQDLQDGTPMEVPGDQDDRTQEGHRGRYAQGLC